MAPRYDNTPSAVQVMVSPSLQLASSPLEQNNLAVEYEIMFSLNSSQHDPHCYIEPVLLVAEVIYA